MKASSKPIIVKVDSGPVKRGEIYYRYPAQVAKIEAADLRRIIDEEVSNRVNKFIESIQKIKEIGIDNVALVNTESGEVDLGNKNSQKLVLNEDTLKKLNLIKHGKLVDKDGAPAYTIKGEIEVEAATRPVLSKEADIYEGFFSQACEHPNLLLQQLTFSSSQYNPLFFLIYKANITKAAASELISSIEGADVVVKTKHEVLKRIENDDITSLHQEGVLISFLQLRIESGKTLEESIQLVFDTHSEIKSSERAKVIRTLAYNNLINKISIPDELYEDHLKRILEAASHFSTEFITDNKEYVLEQMQKMYLLISVMKPTESTLIRKVICNIDRVLYLNSI
jgi:translation initiation factor 2 beta subunit (eIF-2beta)/eIF-5